VIFFLLGELFEEKLINGKEVESMRTVKIEHKMGNRKYESGIYSITMLEESYHVTCMHAYERRGESKVGHARWNSELAVHAWLSRLL
jgi:hypothetical protein